MVANNMVKMGNKLSLGCFWGAIALLASAMSACTNETQEADHETEVPHVFAYIAQNKDCETKTYIDTWDTPKIYWHEDDSIAVFDRDISGIFEFDGQTGDSNGSFSFIDGYNMHENLLYSIYPSSAFSYLYDNQIFFNLPSSQKYAPNGFAKNAAIMVAKSDHESYASFAFMPIVSYLKIRLHDSESSVVKKIELKNLDEGPLAGPAGVVVDDNGTYSFSMYNDSELSSDTIVLDCGEGVQLDGSIDFWFVIPPITLSSGFVITVTDVNGRVFEKSSETERSFSMNTFYSMPDIECEFVSMDGLVDLGLSVKWSSYNLGSSEATSPGNLYAWGETEPRSDYLEWMDYKYNSSLCSAYQNASKYVMDKTFGTYDNKILLDGEDDAATVALHGMWRTPTIAELKELADPDKCSWTTEYDDDGNLFYRITSLVEGYEGNSIILPEGRYWSSSVNSGYNLDAEYMAAESTLSFDHITRNQRHFVRPVYGTPRRASGLTLTTWYNMYPYRYSQGVGSFALEANVYPESAENKDVVWKSDNEKVATVSSNGTVTFVSPGTTSITATTVDGGYSVKSTVTMSDATRGVSVVDLGLSVKWTDRNIGSSNPTYYGDYYAWGETLIKEYYSNTNYKHYDKSVGKYSKYAYGDRAVAADEKSTLELEDDAAHHALGGKYRIPTKAEWQELLDEDNCQWTVTIRDGVKGYLVTSKKSGFEGNSIFFPFCGYIRFSSFMIDQTGGIYMSSTLDTTTTFFSYGVGVYEDNVAIGVSTRIIGHAIRAVYDEQLQ